jgi:hypothetical protein
LAPMNYVFLDRKSSEKQIIYRKKAVKKPILSNWAAHYGEKAPPPLVCKNNFHHNGQLPNMYNGQLLFTAEKRRKTVPIMSKWP